MTDLMTIDTFTGNQEQFMTDLIETKGNNLPAKIEDVIQVFEFTDFKAKAFKMMADKAKKLDEQSEIYHSALRSGQKWGIATLYSQKRMGEITKEIPKAKRGPKNNLLLDEEIIISKVETLKAQGVNPQIVSEAELLSNNSEILDRVIQESEERGEIPTKAKVLHTIRTEKAQERSKIKVEAGIQRKIKDTPKEVKEYFKANTLYKNEISFAIEYAKHGLFSQESINMIKTRHLQIIELMTELEELI